MTERLPEQKQRGIYEWFYPELKGEKWWIALRQGDPVAVWDYNPDRDAYAGKVPLQDLYMPDGKVNYNFVWECIERLEQEHIRVMYDTADHLWYFWFLDSYGAGAVVVVKNLAFWFALSELRGSDVWPR